jgi:hypothetical protein
MILNIVLIILIIIVLSIILIIVMVWYKSRYYEPNKNITDMDESEMSKLKTGDLIFFTRKTYDGYTDMITYTMRTYHKWTNTMNVGHVGMIMKDKYGQLYVNECNSSDHCLKGLGASLNRNMGVRIVPFNDLIDEYRNNYDFVFGILPIRNELDCDVVLNHTLPFINCEFESIKSVFVVNLIDTISNKLAVKYAQKYMDSTKVTCAEYIALLLSSLGILELNTVSKLFTPNKYIGKRFNEMTNDSYSKLLLFK